MWAESGIRGWGLFVLVGSFGLLKGKVSRGITYVLLWNKLLVALITPISTLTTGLYHICRLLRHHRNLYYGHL